MISYKYDDQGYLITLFGALEDKSKLESIRRKLYAADQRNDVNHKPTFLKNEIKIIDNHDGSLTMPIECNNRKGLGGVMTILMVEFDISTKQNIDNPAVSEQSATNSSKSLIFQATNASQKYGQNGCEKEEKSSSPIVKPNSVHHPR